MYTLLAMQPIRKLEKVLDSLADAEHYLFSSSRFSEKVRRDFEPAKPLIAWSE
jgi:hypothetical protein